MKKILNIICAVIALILLPFAMLVESNPRPLRIFPAILTVHDNTNVTGDSGMNDEMKTFYSTYLIDYAKPELIHNQFGQKHPIPKNGGKIIEFRKKTPFAKALTPLTEGVTPSGQKLAWSTITATVNQYGSYVELSDRLIIEAIDNNILYATENCGDQAGRTLDTVVREILNGGTNVQYAGGQVAARYLLVGGSSTAANNHYLTTYGIELAVRNLKAGGGKPINGHFVCIAHIDTLFDVMHDSKWIETKQYSDPNSLYEGEIGAWGKVRFVETTEAKVFHAADLVASGANAKRTLTVASYNAKVITIDEALAAGDATALAGRKIIVDGYLYTVVSAAAGAAGAATITISETPSHNPADNDVVYPGEAGAAGRDVYSSLFIGADAYGTTDIDGEGLKTIIKQLGSAGTGDPLDQRATVGWKASLVAERLVEAYMLRVETASTFEFGAN
jgi:N4-gp56 family major capsid protein